MKLPHISLHHIPRLRRRKLTPREWALRATPFCLTLGIIVVCLIFLANHDFDDLLSYTPDNYFLAFAVLMGFYALKSLSVVFPLTALFLAAGAIYPFWLASLVNMAGLMICYTLPYLVGRFSGGSLMDIIMKKYPKSRKLIAYTHENDLLASYMTRAVVFVPGDIVSMIHGALKMPYKPYLIGSLVGTVPQMLVQTYLGANLSELDLKTVLVFLGLTGLTMLLALPFNKKVSPESIRDDREMFYEFDYFEEWADEEGPEKDTVRQTTIEKETE